MESMYSLVLGGDSSGQEGRNAVDLPAIRIAIQIESALAYQRRLVPLGFLLVLLLCGCGATRKVTHPVKSVEQTLGHPPTLDLIVDVAPDANNNSPIAFDVVLATDKALVKKLLAMSAADWFNKREQIKRDYQGKIQVHSWEWVPGQDVGKVPVEVSVSVVGAVGFADYSTSGEHRAILPLSGPATIAFNKEDLSVSPAK